jgi:peroxiredoxin
MSERGLQPGDRAPDFTLYASRGDDVSEVSLGSLLEGKRGLVLTTYVLDFTGG